MTWRHVTNLAKINAVYAFDVMESLTSNKAARLGIHKVRSIIDQQYVGDINIIPERGIGNVKHIFANPSEKSIKKLIGNAERATWSQLNTIERNTRISKTFNKYLRLLKAREERLLSHHNGLRVVNQ